MVLLDLSAVSDIGDCDFMLERLHCAFGVGVPFYNASSRIPLVGHSTYVEILAGLICTNCCAVCCRGRS